MSFQEELEVLAGKIHLKLMRAKEDKSLCKDERYMEIYQEGKIRAFKDALSIITSLKEESQKPPSLEYQLLECNFAAGGE